jgi:hypothetical protein
MSSYYIPPFLNEYNLHDYFANIQIANQEKSSFSMKSLGLVAFLTASSFVINPWRSNSKIA